jgi:hypothetical protein
MFLTVQFPRKSQIEFFLVIGGVFLQLVRKIPFATFCLLSAPVAVNTKYRSVMHMEDDLRRVISKLQRRDISYVQRGHHVGPSDRADKRPLREMHWQLCILRKKTHS